MLSFFSSHASAAGQSAAASFLKEHPVATLAASQARPIVIDAGHGGNDFGAVVGGKREKDIALAIALKLRDRLAAAARLTRSSDVFLPLDERVAHSLDWGAAAFVSLHVNQVRSKKNRGITVYAFGRSPWPARRPRRKDLPRLPAPPRQSAQAGAAFAGTIVRSLRARGLRVEPVARSDYYVLKNPGVPSILIELGYLSNPEEAARLNDPAYQDRLAAALAAGLQDYLAKAPALAPKSSDVALRAAPALVIGAP